MAKYDALRAELRKRNAATITMSFAEIDRIVPGGLPPSAYTYQAWWDDEKVPVSHVHKIAIHEAGYRVSRYDLPARTVTFTRIQGR